MDRNSLPHSHEITNLSKYPNLPGLSSMDVLRLGTTDPKIIEIYDLPKGLSERFKERANALKSGYDSLKLQGGKLKDLKIAYRLTPKTEEVKKDHFGMEKMGGIPNLGLTVWKQSFMDQKDYQKRFEQKSKKEKPLKYNFPSLEEFIDKNWPRCSCCHERMMFFGQFSIGEWLFVLHSATAKKSTSYGRDYYTSGLGGADGFGHKAFMVDQWYSIWYCARDFSNHYNNPNSDGRIYVSDYYYKENHSDVPSKVLDYSKEDYEAAVLEFQKMNFSNKEVQEDQVPLKAISGFELGFDVEAKTSDDWKELDKLQNSPLVKSRGDFHLFGLPASQQEPKRPICPNGYGSIHGLAPIVNWHNPTHDLTHQMYGCMSCVAREHVPEYIWGKLDNSCT